MSYESEGYLSGQIQITQTIHFSSKHFSYTLPTKSRQSLRLPAFLFIERGTCWGFALFGRRCRGVVSIPCIDYPFGITSNEYIKYKHRLCTRQHFYLLYNKQICLFEFINKLEQIILCCFFVNFKFL